MGNWFLLQFLHGVRWLITVSPRWAVTGFTNILVCLVWIFARKDRAIIRRNVEAVYQLRAGTYFARLFERQVLRHQVTTTMEMIRVIFKPADLQVDNFAEFKSQLGAMLGAGQPIVFFSGHCGCWELAASIMAKASGGRFHGLAKPIKNQALNKFLEHTRALMGAEVIWTNRQDLRVAMIETLKRVGHLGFVMDQKPKNKGMVVNFFGRETLFVAGPAWAAHEVKANVVTIVCTRVAPYRYRMHLKEIANLRNESLTPQELTQVMADEIERMARIYPEQYTWNYKRWKI